MAAPASLSIYSAAFFFLLSLGRKILCISLHFVVAPDEDVAYFGLVSNRSVSAQRSNHNALKRIIIIAECSWGGSFDPAAWRLLLSQIRREMFNVIRFPSQEAHTL
jgi:hypothetical protein